MQNFYRNSESSAYTPRQSYTEPRICYDDDCSYPFGPACSECIFAFDLAQARKSNNHSKERIKGWIDETTADMEQVIDPSQNHIAGNNNKEEVHPTNISHLANASKYRSGEVFIKEDTTDLYTPNTTTYESPNAEERAANPSTPSSVQDKPPSNSLDDWLSELFSNTLERQLDDPSFIGGATDENKTLDFCPFCYKSLGDPRDQHLLRCQYAHEEQERMNSSIARAEKRTWK